MWKEQSSFTLLLAFMVFALSISADAKKLPDRAKAMSTDEVRLTYSGRSVMTGESRIYFSPDMTAKAVIHRGRQRMALSGTWYVSVNEICVSLQSSDGAMQETECWKWWWFETDTYTLWSVHSDGTRADEENGYFDQSSALKQGDSVSEEYEELVGPPRGMCLQC